MADGGVPAEYYVKQSVEVDVLEGTLKGLYNTRIANLNDQALLLEVPLIGNMYLPLKIGQPMKLRYIVESWAYEAAVTVAARKDNLDTPIMLVARPKQVDRKMLRQFVRVESDLDASVYLIKDLSEYGREKYSDNDLTQCVIVDISGGGAKARVPLHLPTVDKRYALLWFTLPLIHKSFYNQLTRIKFVQDDERDKYIVVEFTGLSEAEREDIVHYCSRRQLELMKTQVKPEVPK